MKKKTIIMIITLASIFVLACVLGLYREQLSSPASPVDRAENADVTNQETSEPEATEDIPNKASHTPFTEFSKEFKAAIQSTIKFFSTQESHIVAIGDSLTQGVGDSTKQGGYVGILDSQLNADANLVTFDNYGKRGNRTDQLLKRIDEPEIVKSLKRADIVIMTIGANDIMQVLKENFTNITYEAFSKERVNYEKRLHQIFAKLEELNPNASVYLVGFYNPFQQYFEHIKELDMIVDNWNHTSEQVAKEAGATFIPTKDIFISTEVNLFADDHFHPNDIGYKLIAERILNYLVRE
ncbi:SGNH/GDSL hydrolase family protein [Ornithinibacillus sp. FSL M8-0202]|uniref:SGNH/GDSL hydrolase family protein n=1 Tax=Ornithinibacillus sp. FSL M8-0202 TaxID=2921616 RepID=UPI0030CA8F89